MRPPLLPPPLPPPPAGLLVLAGAGRCERLTAAPCACSPMAAAAGSSRYCRCGGGGAVGAAACCSSKGHASRPLLGTGTARLVLDPLLTIVLPLLAALAAARGPMALALRSVYEYFYFYFYYYYYCSCVTGDALSCCTRRWSERGFLILTAKLTCIGVHTCVPVVNLLKLLASWCHYTLITR
jgi:hypothetical protein